MECDGGRQALDIELDLGRARLGGREGGGEGRREVERVGGSFPSLFSQGLGRISICFPLKTRVRFLSLPVRKLVWNVCFFSSACEGQSGSV